MCKSARCAATNTADGVVNSRLFFLELLEAGSLKVKVKVLGDPVPGESPLPGPAGSSQGGEGRALVSPPALIRTLISSRGPLPHDLA